ncbi:response regulator transcription factor [Pararhizobium sp. YC-54]|uniref:response regulator n=1 Tax=Pararhizobium sp. YC-54 TaxID=2986920 RepID=UPI0021F71AF0|nr:response regulator transcription factor [Pararhizobium sp. YC-54]MCV9999422.1 response regulator transcription factor [Pararhizobium sp. YC-54]
MSTIRVAVIDDHPIFREGVASCLTDMGGYDIVGEGGSCEDAQAIAQQADPDVMLLDISMPGGGLNAVASILERRPAQKIIMLTVSESHSDVAKALQLGAKGYVLKGVGSRALSEILRTVQSGEMYLSPTLSARMIAGLSKTGDVTSTTGIRDLTEREYDVLRLVASGLSNKRIARDLDLHEKTVKHYLTRIFTKLNVSNRTEAAMAFRDASETASPLRG